MVCHGIIEAPNYNYARNNWERLLRSQGFAVQPFENCEGPPHYDQLIRIPDELQNFPNECLLNLYGND
jgi:hypothetical protein